MSGADGRSSGPLHAGRNGALPAVGKLIDPAASVPERDREKRADPGSGDSAYSRYTRGTRSEMAQSSSYWMVPARAAASSMGMSAPPS